MIRLATWLREWLLSGLQVCGQCGCLCDRRHGSAACGRHLRDTVQDLQQRERGLAARMRAWEEQVRALANLLPESADHSSRES